MKSTYVLPIYTERLYNYYKVNYNYFPTRYTCSRKGLGSIPQYKIALKPLKQR